MSRIEMGQCLGYLIVPAPIPVAGPLRSGVHPAVRLTGMNGTGYMTSGDRARESADTTVCGKPSGACTWPAIPSVLTASEVDV